jgi:hypothetical protein
MIDRWYLSNSKSWKKWRTQCGHMRTQSIKIVLFTNARWIVPRRSTLFCYQVWSPRSIFCLFAPRLCLEFYSRSKLRCQDSILPTSYPSTPPNLSPVPRPSQPSINYPNAMNHTTSTEPTDVLPLPELNNNAPPDPRLVILQTRNNQWQWSFNPRYRPSRLWPKRLLQFLIQKNPIRRRPAANFLSLPTVALPPYPSNESPEEK